MTSAINLKRFLFKNEKYRIIYSKIGSEKGQNSNFVYYRNFPHGEPNKRK